MNQGKQDKKDKEKRLDDRFSKVLSAADRDIAKPDPAFLARLSERSMQEFLATQKQKPKLRRYKIMHLKTSKWLIPPAAAAILVIVGVIFTGLMDQIVTPAYAIEQTIEASRNVRFVHYVYTYWEHGKQVARQEMWKKLDRNGDVLALRVDGGSGHIEVVSEKLMRKIWRPGKNQFFIEYAWPYERGRYHRKWGDPRFAAELLDEWKAEGKISLEIEEPDRDGEPIRVTALHTDEFSKQEGYSRHFVLLIDPVTKLAQQSEIYRPSDDNLTLQERRVFLEYNQPIKPEMFDLKPPPDAEIIDLTKNIGFVQGNLTEAEAASETVRQCIEALIAKDYEKVAALCSNGNADQVRKGREGRTFLRIVDIGEPEPFTTVGLHGFMVPFEYEFEQDGVKDIWGPRKAFSRTDSGPLQHVKAIVRPVPGHPDRWVIVGNGP